VIVTVRASACAIAGLVAVACSSTTSPTGSYVIAFQSTAQAIATSDVRMYVFEASTLSSSEPCLDLLSLRESGQDLPATVLEEGPTSACELARGGTSFDVPLESLAILVVAETPAGDFARGCALHAFTADDPSVTIALALAPGRAVPSTTCTSLSEHCAGGC
jgi:hypothetical protein